MSHQQQLPIDGNNKFDDMSALTRNELECWNRLLVDQVKGLKDKLNQLEQVNFSFLRIRRRKIIQNLFLKVQNIKNKQNVDELEHYKQVCESECFRRYYLDLKQFDRFGNDFKACEMTVSG